VLGYLGSPAQDQGFVLSLPGVVAIADFDVLAEEQDEAVTKLHTLSYDFTFNSLPGKSSATCHTAPFLILHFMFSPRLEERSGCAAAVHWSLLELDGIRARRQLRQARSRRLV
jgi:hypothetical protein